METFDISTREGFLRDFDLLEKAVLKARNQIGADAADEILMGTLKKNCGSQNRERETAVESELGRIPVCLMDDMAQSLQPKERVCSTGYMELSCRLCTKLSYRNATEMINLFQHRDAGETIKLRTLSDSVERVGEQISARLEEMTQKVLKMYGFDSETGRPMEGVCLSASITSPPSRKRQKLTYRQWTSLLIQPTHPVMKRYRSRRKSWIWRPHHWNVCMYP